MIRRRGISNHLITQMRKSEKAWRKKDSENIPARMMTNHREEEVLLLLYIPAILSLFLSPETIDLQKNEAKQNKREKQCQQTIAKTQTQQLDWNQQRREGTNNNIHSRRQIRSKRSHGTQKRKEKRTPATSKSHISPSQKLPVDSRLTASLSHDRSAVHTERQRDFESQDCSNLDEKTTSLLYRIGRRRRRRHCYLFQKLTKRITIKENQEEEEEEEEEQQEQQKTSSSTVIRAIQEITDQRNSLQKEKK